MIVKTRQRNFCKIKPMKTIGERLKFRRDQLGISQRVVSDRVRRLRPKSTFSQQAYAQLESGKSQNSVELPAICEALEIDLSWIRDGKGIAPLAPQNEKNTKPVRKIVSSIDSDLGIVRQNAIIEADVRAGAGGGGLAKEAFIFDKNGSSYAANDIAGEWSLPPAVMREMLHASPNHIQVFEVIGDSMEPRLNEGDRVFVDIRYKVPNPEGIFVLWDGHSIVVKRLQIIRGTEPLRVRVISANPQYEPYEVLAEEINVVGRYAGRFTTS